MGLDLINKRERILFTTIDVIDEYGIHAVSTKEIARRQGISESTIFKYFPRKVDLFEAVLDFSSQFDMDLFETTKLRGMKPKEAIIFYIDSISSNYENYPAITAITQSYDILRYEARLEEKVKNITDSRTDFIKGMIEESRVKGEIPKNVESEELAGILLSTVSGICLNWRISRYAFPLRKKIIHSIEMILDIFGI